MNFYEVVENRRPVFIGIGYADSNEQELEQKYPEIEKQLHYGRWK